MKKKLFTKILVGILLVVGIAWLVCRYYNPQYESTDDAQVDQYVSPVNVKISGYICEIRFTEHQHVTKGDTLVVIDNREFLIALHQAEASLMDARSGRKVAEGSLNTASSSATVYESSIREAELRAEKLGRDYERYTNLLAKKATTPVIVEQYKTEYDMAKAKVDALKQQREAAKSSVSEVGQRRENATAAILRAEAAVEMAKLNLSYTVITAPVDGYVGRRNIEGFCLFQLVEPSAAVLYESFGSRHRCRACKTS